MATQFKITIGDNSETFTVKPKHVLHAERKFKDMEPVEGTYRLAWLASGTSEDFDDWMDSVDDIEPILDDAYEEEQPEPGPTTKGSRASRS